MAVSEKLRKKLEKRKQQINDKGKGFGYEVFKEGKKVIRALPVGDDEDFAMEVEMFYLGKDIGSFISPRTFGDACAVYDAYEELRKSKDEDDNTTAATFKPKKMNLMAGLVAKDERGKVWDDEKGATLIKITGGMASELIDWMLDEDAGDFTDAKEGYPIKVKRTGSGQFDTEYTLIKLDKQKLPKIYNKVYNLEKMIKAIIPTFEQTEEFLNQFLGGGVDEDKPKKKKKGSKDKDKKSSSKSKDKDGKKKKKKRTSDI